jgi:hypothetical protein
MQQRFNSETNVSNNIINSKISCMAKNGKVNDGHRDGAVRNRSQVFNPKTERWIKRDAESGRFMDQKANEEPFKGIRKEK